MDIFQCSLCARVCIYLSGYCIVIVCVCGPALHCAGGQNTRDCFDLDSLCLVQSQSCHQLPTAAATHSWCREEILLVVTLCTFYKNVHEMASSTSPTEASRCKIKYTKRTELSMGRSATHPDMLILRNTCIGKIVPTMKKQNCISRLSGRSA